MDQKVFLLSAGGTGGHLFPAQALSVELSARGHKVHLATDNRASRYADTFPCDEMHIVPSSTIGSKNPFKVAKSLWTLFQGMRKSSHIIRTLRPNAVIGFGGYPTLPPLLSATQAGKPSILHEQNAVMGRANKLLANRVTAIAGGFLPANSGQYSDKTIVTGNPVRPAVIEAAEQAYQSSGGDDEFNLVVFGGSQGAQFFGVTIPKAIAAMSKASQKRLKLTLQARDEDVEQAKAACAEMNIDAEISTFFDDMAKRIADAHLVISRSGASTVSELAAIGRPAILVPYPFALDHDQAANAKGMLEKGGAEVIAQSELSAEKLAEMIENRMNNPQEAEKMAAKAKLAGNLEATRLLADLVEAMAEGTSIKEFKDQYA
ncbi:MAG: undecaprenyldiphospho-muramoylpentapeptide beta-N-acetylglucosaminyltransferase [Rhizobiaceae bacterium]|nr:undecaprenyldiphospho-muramoylpentapeptide beta-N-acetylglucosaminyltransferase [Rhizobiaceae bacterium]